LPGTKGVYSGYISIDRNKKGRILKDRVNIYSSVNKGDLGKRPREKVTLSLMKSHGVIWVDGKKRKKRLGLSRGYNLTGE